MAIQRMDQAAVVVDDLEAIRGEPANALASRLGLRSIMFAVDDVDATLAGLRAHGAELVEEMVQYEDSYWLCYVRGPAGSSSRWPSRAAHSGTDRDTAATPPDRTRGYAHRCCYPCWITELIRKNGGNARRIDGSCPTGSFRACRTWR